jgi:pimeloyl-ACP methyl ester carboxylesterase
MLLPVVAQRRYFPPMARGIARGAVLLLALLALSASPASASTQKLRLGTLTLERCGGGQHGWCGSLSRPLDPGRPHGPHIHIAFHWLPASHPANKPAIVAVEGGPGYPSTGSLYEYHGIYSPLLRSRNLLLVDNRGTGGSGLIDCPSVQTFTGPSWGPAFAGRVAACARLIERRYPGVHAADLFGTAYAADDLAAVLRALRLGRVDLYGDSYGTWFAQSFIARHPSFVHSLTLDSAYPVVGLDPWYASSGPVARNALDAVCARDPGCSAAAAGSGTASDRLAQLLARLRVAPISGSARDADGSRSSTEVTPRTLVDLVQDAASDPVIYRELDPSVRAALAGDPAPLLRLAVQSGTYDHGASTPDYFTDGLYFAVSCVDYPQLFSMSSSPAQRRAQLAASIAAPPSGDPFAPFTTAEWLQMSAYDEPYMACLDWPQPAHTAPPVPAGWQPLPASVPVLILGGDLDSLTPEPDVEKFGPTLGRHVRIVKLSNAVHVSSEGDTLLAGATRCARRIIRAFVQAPGKLDSLDTRCAAAIPPLHTAGAYPATFAAATPATLLSGTDPGIDARRAATVAAGALADATIRRFYSGVDHGPGLRGGSFTTTGDSPIQLKLSGIRFVGDAPASGSGHWAPGTGNLSGRLAVTTPAGAKVNVSLSWSQRSTAARATIGGAVLTLPAP